MSRVLQVIVLLILGTTINLMVAWGFAYWSPSRGGFGVTVNAQSPSAALWNDAFGESVFVSDFEASRSLDPSTVARSARFGSMIFWVQEYRSDTLGVTRIQLVDTLRSMPPHMVIVQAGFPMRAFVYRAVSDTRSTLATGGFIWHRPIKGMAGFTRHEFPYKPILPCFALNTLIYAGVSWLVFLAFCRCRIWNRRRRNLCVHCGYDLRSAPSATCPECGQSSLA